MNDSENLKTAPSDADLFEGAGSRAPVLPAELQSQREIASDNSRPLEDRLEAFEDILESEIGDTTLARARNIEREVGLRQIFLKFEGGNPSGTQKDRIAFAQVMDALRRGFDSITVATCGNFGVALSLASSAAGLRSLIFIPRSYHTRRIREIEQYPGVEIIRVEGDYERAVEVSRQRAEKDEVYDANPGGANTVLQLKAYGEIAYEIYDELRDAPATVAVPVSNGTTLAGVYKGFVSLYRRGRTSRIPRIVAGSSYGKNPIVRAYLKDLPECEDLPRRAIRETAVNEPLINWHAADGDWALEAVRNSEGWAAPASDRKMSFYSRQLRDLEGLHVLPASTAGLIALIDRHKQDPLPNDRYVVLLTGRKS